MLTAVARDAAGHTASDHERQRGRRQRHRAAHRRRGTSPAAGAIAGSVTVAAAASDDLGVAGVQFIAERRRRSATRMTAAPYELNWNSGSAANGAHVLTAVARDAAGHETSASVGVTVANDHSAPTLTLTAPAGAIGGIASIVATASDDIGVVTVEFLADANIPGPAVTAAPVPSGRGTRWA